MRIVASSVDFGADFFFLFFHLWTGGAVSDRLSVACDSEGGEKLIFFFFSVATVTVEGVYVVCVTLDVWKEYKHYGV